GRWAFEGSGTPPAQIASSSIDITGPDEIEVGEPAVFTAETDGVNSWVWTLPSHRYVSDQGTVTITPTSPGTAVVVRRSQTPEGGELEVRHSVQVVEWRFLRRSCSQVPLRCDSQMNHQLTARGTHVTEQSSAQSDHRRHRHHCGLGSADDRLQRRGRRGRIR